MDLAILVIDPAKKLGTAIRELLAPRDVWTIEVEALDEALAYVERIRLDLIVVGDDGSLGLALVSSIRSDPNELIRGTAVLLLAQPGSAVLAPRTTCLGPTACVDATLWPHAAAEALRVLLPGLRG